MSAEREASAHHSVQSMRETTLRVRSPTLTRDYTSRLCTTAAWMNDANSGCGSNGRDFSSGWNCTPMNQGWSSYSTISGSTPSGDRPEKRRPCCSSRSL